MAWCRSVDVSGYWAMFLVFVLVTPVAIAAVDPDAPGPLETGLSLGAGTHTHIGETYSIELQWDPVVQGPGEGLVRGQIEAGGRSGVFAQHLSVGHWEVFVGDWPWITPQRPVFTVDATTGETDGVSWLRLDYGSLPVSSVPEVDGFVEFRFHGDHVLHHYGFRLPSAWVAPVQISQLHLEWEHPVDAYGSIYPHGVIHPGDDGSALDPYGVWEQHVRYATYQEDAQGLSAHARIDQGGSLNYMVDGWFRVDAETSVVRSTFNGLFNYDVLMDDEAWAIDALFFAPSGGGVQDVVSFLDGFGSGGDDPGSPDDPGPPVDEPEPPFPVVDPTDQPVVVAIPDSGINPYHELFYRPELTEHPCTYIEDFPCDIPALELSIGVYDNYEEAYVADKEIWAGVETGDWYWIPRTLFVAVHCEAPYRSSTYMSEHCILDDHGHGTGTTSSVVTENPDVLIAFKEGGSSVRPFFDKKIPVDVYSVSWGHSVPVPMPAGTCLGLSDLDEIQSDGPRSPVYVTSAGNDPGVSTMLDCWSGDPRIISVGGAYAEGGSQELFAYKEPDVVSYFCRPAAQAGSIDGWLSDECGTSFGAPTVAGALSKVIQAVRRDSGHSGAFTDGMVDPTAGFSVHDLREAMNRTASYDPDPRYDNNGGVTGIPVNPEAPWLQWGWGFYDSWVAEVTIDHIFGIEPAPEKPEAARLYMETLYAGRTLVYGPPQW